MNYKYIIVLFCFDRFFTAVITCKDIEESKPEVGSSEL